MKKERWASLGLFIFALITIHESFQLPIWEHGTPMSGLFPLVLGVLLAFFVALYFLHGKLKKGRKKGGTELKSQWIEGPESPLEASKVDWRKVLFTLGAVAVYPFLFMKGGYIVGTAIFLLFMCKVVERLKIAATLAITLVIILASYTIFGLLLKVPLH